MRHKADVTRKYITWDLDLSNHSDDNGEGEDEYLLTWKKKKKGGDKSNLYSLNGSWQVECLRNNDELGLKYKEY